MERHNKEVDIGKMLRQGEQESVRRQYENAKMVAQIFKEQTLTSDKLRKTPQR